ncbi:WecB/TagA/CpsF family glycosyltransferase [Brevibacillus daliensis]|uniref:WecB/TagA/CpsF family glycosyltransferase n=1 Tax=Brevibacillus daliensis TaxID=2892995 RepID=UPI001E28B495|nr:WecB/TagA/CpsF family glycosyltransferase [Brevibacillus daliensis]
MNVIRILGVPFSKLGFQETVDYFTAEIKAGNRTRVMTVNPEMVMMAQGNSSMRKLIEQAHVTPDGIGIVKAARWTNQPIPERVTGVELLVSLMEKANENNWGVYLLGAAPDVSQKAAEILAERYPHARIVGRQDGFFNSEQEKQIVADIREKKPELLFVAMGAPKQDEWIAKHWEALPVNLAMGVGGSLDIISGKVKRAPKFWQAIHLEWFYRLLATPSRWRRQVAIPKFIVAVLWGRLNKRT